jgi:ferric-dicitrate binding protein FerR (iron transport regulator)
MDYKTAFSLFSSGMLALQKNDINTTKSKLDQLNALFWRNSQLENEKEKLNKFLSKITKYSACR